MTLKKCVAGLSFLAQLADKYNIPEILNSIIRVGFRSSGLLSVSEDKGKNRAILEFGRGRKTRIAFLFSSNCLNSYGNIVAYDSLVDILRRLFSLGVLPDIWDGRVKKLEFPKKEAEQERGLFSTLGQFLSTVASGMDDYPPTSEDLEHLSAGRKILEDFVGSWLAEAGKFLDGDGVKRVIEALQSSTFEMEKVEATSSPIEGVKKEEQEPLKKEEAEERKVLSPYALLNVELVFTVLEKNKDRVETIWDRCDAYFEDTMKVASTMGGNIGSLVNGNILAGLARLLGRIDSQTVGERLLFLISKYSNLLESKEPFLISIGSYLKTQKPKDETVRILLSLISNSTSSMKPAFDALGYISEYVEKEWFGEVIDMYSAFIGYSAGSEKDRRMKS